MAYVRTRLGRWFYQERGAPRRSEDAAIVLLHGLLFDGGMWAAQVGPLSELGRVIVIDGPGHGKSEVPPPFTLEDHAEALLDVFRELSVSRAVLVGLSWGGMLSMRVALAHPTHVKAMALLDTSADAEQLRLRVRYRILTSFARRFGLPSRLVHKEIGPLLYTDRTLHEKPELVEEFIRAVNSYPREGMARAALAVVVHRKGVLEKLANVRAPTLIICGREDQATIPLHSEAMARVIPGARLVWMEECGHMSAIERPEQVNATLVPFVREHVGA
jgi:3-oxoadipate enol-lactonase